MQYVKRILKELIYAVVLLGIVFLVGFLLFRNRFDFLSSSIPNAVTYPGLDLTQYDIQGDFEDQKDPTKVYQATTGSLKNLEELRKVHTGTPNPFSSKLDDDSDTDIPSERVTIKNTAEPDKYQTKAADTTPEEEAKASDTESAEATSKEGEKALQ